MLKDQIGSSRRLQHVQKQKDVAGSSYEIGRPCVTVQHTSLLDRRSPSKS